MAEAQAGETAKLGALVAQARTGQRARWVMLVVKGSVAVVFAVVTAAIARGLLTGELPLNRWVLVLAGAAIVVSLGVDVANLLRRRDTAVAIYRRGIVVTEDGVTQTLRWRDLRRVEQKAPAFLGEGVFRIELYGPESDPVILRPPLPLTTLGKAIEAGIAPHLHEGTPTASGTRIWK